MADFPNLRQKKADNRSTAVAPQSLKTNENVIF